MGILGTAMIQHVLFPQLESEENSISKEHLDKISLRIEKTLT